MAKFVPVLSGDMANEMVTPPVSSQNQHVFTNDKQPIGSDNKVETLSSLFQYLIQIGLEALLLILRVHSLQIFEQIHQGICIRIRQE